MPSFLSIHVGVPDVDGASYARPPSPLVAPTADAEAMADLATCQHFEVRPPLLGQNATRDALLAELDRARGMLDSGSLLLVTFSGHGAQVPDRGETRRTEGGGTRGEERDGLDEAWCLWDGFFLDDELHDQLAELAPGVRVLICSDACHAGSMLEAFPPPVGLRSRAYATRDAGASYDAQATTYDGRRAALAGRPMRGPKAVVHLGACRDEDVAFENDEHGAFTAALLAVWARGSFQGDHRDLHARLISALAGLQVPTLTTSGDVEAFLSHRPFTL